MSIMFFVFVYKVSFQNVMKLPVSNEFEDTYKISTVMSMFGTDKLIASYMRSSSRTYFQSPFELQ